MFDTFARRAVVALFALGLVLGTPSLSRLVFNAPAGSAVFAAEAGEGEHAEGDHDEGPPLTPGKNLAIWSLVVFVLYLIAAKFIAWKPLVEGFTAREERIRNDLVTTESERKKAEQLSAERERELADVGSTRDEILAEARRDAEQTASRIVEDARAEAVATRERAEQDRQQAVDAALAELFRHENARVTEATRQVLGRALTDQDQERLVEQALAELPSASTASTSKA